MKAWTMVLVSMAAIFGLTQCKSTQNLNKDTREWRYEIEAENTATQGSYLVKLWTYAHSVADAERQTKKNAVHGVLFKGFPTKGRVKGQKPLVRNKNALEEHKAFFAEFFEDGGEYARFVTVVHSNEVKAGDVVKVGEEYKVGYIVSVQASELRKYLEQNEIIETLDSGF